MKIKIRQLSKKITPRIIEGIYGSQFTLKIQETVKYGVYPFFGISFIEIEIEENFILSQEFFQTIINNVDETLAGIRIRRSTPGQGLGFTYEYGNYLQPWTGNIFYSSFMDDYKDVASGITYKASNEIPWNPPNSDGSGGTYSNQGLGRWTYLQRGYHFGTRGCGGNGIGCNNVIVESLMRRYEPKGWMVDLNGTRGVTLRGGTYSWFVQPKTLEEYQKIKKPLSSNNPDISTTTWSNFRNKLLFYLSRSDETDTLEYLNNLSYLTNCLVYNTEIQKTQTGDSESFKSTDIQIINKDLQETIKTICSMLKDRKQMIRPNNSASDTSSTVTWFSGQPGIKYGFNLGGICLYNEPIGQTLDWNTSTGASKINTASATGITAHQGYYLYEGWANQGLLNFVHPLLGITTQSSISTEIDKALTTEIRKLMWREVFSRVYHTREARPWFIDWTLPLVEGYTPRSLRPPNTNTGSDVGEFREDLDTWGYINNQWINPIVWSTLLAMFLYKYAESDIERNAARKAYNLGTEIIAAFIMRATRDEAAKRAIEGNNYNPVGAFLEGRGYAEQSQDDICELLFASMKIGDYRLWELNGGTGGNWIDNQWKYYYYTNLPNNLRTNSQSDTSSNFENSLYQETTVPSNQHAMLVSRTPTPGTTGSAIAEHYGYFLKPYYPISQLIAYKLWNYAQGVTYSKVLPNWAFISQEKMIVWHSQIPVPYTQADTYPVAVAGSFTNTTKPVIFSLWAKAHGSYEMKSHKDAGHVSVYLGDAPILIETGEIRAFGENYPDEFILKHQGVMGHNTMQLGQKHPAGFGTEGTVLNYGGSTLGGFIQMDIKNQYNSRGLTSSNPPPCGGFKTSTGLPLIPYTYQIGTCTRGISWTYDIDNKLGKVYIEDNLGISGISSGATPLNQRVYYRFHTGYNKFGVLGSGISTNGYDDIGESRGKGLTFYPTTSGLTTWEIGWNTRGITLYNLNMNWVGVTMTVKGSQPLWINKEIYTSNSFKKAPNVGLTANQQKHYAINIGITGAGNPYTLTLNTDLVCRGYPPDQLLLFYDGSTGPYTTNVWAGPGSGKYADPQVEAVGGQYMYYLQLDDAGYALGSNKAGWTSGTPYDWFTGQEVEGMVKTLVLQGATFTTKGYAYVNWTEDDREFIILNGHTGPGTTMGCCFRTAADHDKLQKTMAKYFTGGTSSKDGLFYNGLRHYFPGISFGIYNMPQWWKGNDMWLWTTDEIENSLEFLANVVVGCNELMDSIQLLMPSLYLVTNSREMMRVSNWQVMQLCNKINNKLITNGKQPKQIVPFHTPQYATQQTGSPYTSTNKIATPNDSWSKTVLGITYVQFRYTPPYTRILEEDLRYEVYEPIIYNGGNAMTMWLGPHYRMKQIAGRTLTPICCEDVVISGPSINAQGQLQWASGWRKGVTGATAVWSQKDLWRQAIAADWTYQAGICLGITGNRWWWQANQSVTGPYGVCGPAEWFPLSGREGLTTGNQPISGAGMSTKDTRDKIDRYLVDIFIDNIQVFKKTWFDIKT